MNMTRRAKLFKNGRSQAVRIPREFEFTSDEVEMRLEGSQLVLKAVSPKAKTLRALLESWEPIDERIGPIEDYPPEPVNL